MPLYGFCCDSCGNEEEELREIDDRNNQKICSKCQLIMRKTINAPACIIFPFKLNAIKSNGVKIPGRFHT